MGLSFRYFLVIPHRPIFRKIFTFSDAPKITFITHVNIPSNSFIYFYFFKSKVGGVYFIYYLHSLEVAFYNKSNNLTTLATTTIMIQYSKTFLQKNIDTLMF